MIYVYKCESDTICNIYVLLMYINRVGPFLHLSFSFIVYPLQASAPTFDFIKKLGSLSIIASINEDDWTSEQERIGL